jgi:hypothetical protein
LLDLMMEGNPDGRAFRMHCPGLRIVDPAAFLSALALQTPASAAGRPGGGTPVWAPHELAWQSLSSFAVSPKEVSGYTHLGMSFFPFFSFSKSGRLDTVRSFCCRRPGWEAGLRQQFESAAPNLAASYMPILRGNRTTSQRPDSSMPQAARPCPPQRATAIDREDSQSSKRVGPRRG